MKLALLIVDVQPCFEPAAWQIEGIARLASNDALDRHREAARRRHLRLGGSLGECRRHHLQIELH